MPEWTRAQKDAISDRGHSLIVCAAAGSGKTAVLVERIVSLVREGCPIENMLIVTFTNAAAGEMRLRIGEALTRAAAEQPELAQEVMALPRASISTLHRFCARLLREHFQAADVDPAFRIGDEQECGVLSRQAMEDALYACYEVGDEDFLAADECYEQEELAETAMSIHRFMTTRPDPHAWLDAAIASCEAGGEGLDFSQLTRDALGRIGALREDADRTLRMCRGEGGPAFYLSACQSDAERMDALAAAAQAGYDALQAELEAASFAPLGRKKKTDVFDEAIAETVKARRDALKKAVAQLKEQFSMPMETARADIRMTAKPLRGLRTLILTYETLYAAAKRRRGILDFDDLEHGALSALKKPEVARALGGQYRYVFVDEYQDSSAIQEAILGAFAPEDGLFLVGDVKQSIYRFRQAEPTLFLEKAERFDRPEENLCRRIDLQSNFRSRANVLAGANAVFERIMKREETEIEYDARERLLPGLPVREDDPPLEMHILYREQESEDEEAGEEDDERELAAAQREALVCAKRMRELVGTPVFDAKLGAERPLEWRDMVVLLRAARSCAPLAAEILSGEGIPVFCDADEGYFDIPEIRRMLSLLAVIAGGAPDEALLSALTGPALGLGDEELARIRLHAPDARLPYREAVRRYREEREDELAERLRAFHARIARWRLLARHQGVDKLIERIYAETGFLAAAGALPGGRARQANLHLLTTRARSFMTSQGGSLGAFLRYAERLRAGGDSMSASAIGESENVVRIMTTHKSKGLEFPVVFVMGMGRKLGGAQRAGHALTNAALGVGLCCIDPQMMVRRETLLRRAIAAKTRGEQLAEEIRILYVAMTRARDRLILVGCAGSTAPGWAKEQPLSQIHSELDMVCPMLMEAGASLAESEEFVRAGESSWRVCTHFGASAGVLGQRSDESVRRLLMQLEQEGPRDESLERLLAFSPEGSRPAARKTSVSAVLRDEKRAADDELRQRDVEVQRLPRFMTEQRLTGAQIGTAFHRAMRMVDLDALKRTDDLAGALGTQREAMLAEGVLAQAEYDAVPTRMLANFFASPQGRRLLRAARVEREWAFTWKRESESGETQLLQGVVDCCFVEDGRWILIDYKTDSPKDIPAVLDKHRPQLQIYASALERITGMPVAESWIYLVRAGVACGV